MNFEWINPTLGEWQTYLSQVPKANWMQAWPYCKASRMRDFKLPKIALIKNEQKTLGFLVFLEIKLGPIHFIELHRGPLWFSNDIDISVWEEFISLFAKTFPSNFFRRRRWLVEAPENKVFDELLTKHGFKKMLPTFETLWLDLKLDEEDIKSQLKQKWRNSLHKAQNSQLEFKESWDGENLNYFIKRYQDHKIEKNYLGLSPLFVLEEIKAALSFKQACLLWTYKEKNPIACIYILIHGTTASYRVGWSSEEGRKCNAHNLLLWNAITILKSKDLHFFDLGGILPVEAKGITQFKLGMGGDYFKSVGLFK